MKKEENTLIEKNKAYDLLIQYYEIIEKQNRGQKLFPKVIMRYLKSEFADGNILNNLAEKIANISWQIEVAKKSLIADKLQNDEPFKTLSALNSKSAYLRILYLKLEPLVINYKSQIK